MTEFEFISVFVSIVLAFAMAEIVMGWGRLIRARKRVTNLFFYAGWSVWLLILMAYHYLGIWEYRIVNFHSVYQLLVLLAPPVVMVLLAFVLTPETAIDESVNLEEHYFNVRKWFFSMVIVFFVLGTLADLLLPDFSSTWESRYLLPSAIVLSMILLLLTSNRRIHFIVLVFNLIYLVLGAFAVNVRSL